MDLLVCFLNNLGGDVVSRTFILTVFIIILGYVSGCMWSREVKRLEHVVMKQVV